MEEKKLNFKNEKNKFLKDIYNDYYKKIYILCFKILNNNDDALDATQETFIQVYKSIDSLKDINKFNSWINKIAISKCSYIIRKNKNIFSTNDELNYVEDDTNIPDVIICEDEKKQLIFKAINKLTLKKRVVILLYYYSELKLEDISRILEIPIRIGSAAVLWRGRKAPRRDGKRSCRCPPCQAPAGSARSDGYTAEFVNGCPGCLQPIPH